MKEKLIIIAINIALVCVIIGGLELIGQVGYRIKTGHFAFEDSRAEHQQVFELHPFLVGRLKSNKTVTKNNINITLTNLHTRWTGALDNSDNKIRIAILGGSTTFGTGVTDADSWPAILQKLLGEKYSVINYGVPGYSTAEAIIQMGLIVPDKKPNYVINYQGWNDLKNYHVKDLGEDYYKHGLQQYTNLRLPFYREKKLLEKLSEIFVLAKLPFKLRNMFIDKEQSTAFDRYSDADESVDKIYTRNLNTLKGLTHSLNAYAIFIPQVLNYSYFNNQSKQSEWIRHINNDAIPKLMDRLNSLMEPICGNNVNCSFLGTILDQKWDNDDFVDDGHFSKKGGEKFARVVGKFIIEFESKKSDSE